jgi:GT2 family glycosyltransferase
MVLVCHFSSEHLPECVASFRTAALRAGVEAEVVVVEQSEDARESEAVHSVRVDQTIIRPNRGYAAGLNAGVECTTGDVVLLANPDIVFMKDSLGAMLRALDSGFDVVGPQFVWDSACEFMLPVAEDPAPSAELRRTIRRRWERPWSVGLATYLEESWRVWTSSGPVDTPGLRGALMAAPSEAVRRYGPLDEGYFLYYEETEWLWRARRQGARLGVAAGAKVVHRWGHSTARRPDAARVEEASRLRFFRRNYGRLWQLLLRRCARGEQRGGAAADVVSGPESVPEIAADLWLLSTFGHFIPAGGAAGRDSMPACVAELAAEGRWYALAATRGDSDWRLAGSWTWSR